jgi:hypothetical protein
MCDENEHTIEDIPILPVISKEYYSFLNDIHISYSQKCFSKVSFKYCKFQ